MNKLKEFDAYVKSVTKCKPLPAKKNWHKFNWQETQLALLNMIAPIENRIVFDKVKVCSDTDEKEKTTILVDKY